MLNQYFEKRELTRRERYVLAVFRETACSEVQTKFAEFRDLCIRARRARRSRRRPSSQYRLDARDELAWVERFGQIVVGADLESDDAIDVVTFRCEHDDRHVFIAAAQPTADREAVFT